jgi:hypothetical protein
MYIDQKDANGNIIQKGLFTIQSETKNNGNPSEAALYNAQETNKLYEYHKNNKFSDVNNLTKQIIQNKFFATAGMLKTKSLEGSRNTQIKDSVNIDEDFVAKEVLILKELGAVYLPMYKKNTEKKIADNPIYDDGQKKILTEGYINFGETTLANSLLVSNPRQLNNLLKNKYF